MTHEVTASRKTLRWSLFSLRDGERIERCIQAGNAPLCPRCGKLLEARADSRFSPPVMLDATAFDLICHQCQRLWCIIRDTPRTLRLLRMRRLAAAVQAVPAAVPASNGGVSSPTN